MGPLSSSHEMEDAEPHYRDYCRTSFASPPAYLIIFVGLPILALVTAASLLPWFYGLELMVSSAKKDGWYKADIHTIFQAFLWWITPRRLGYYFLLRIIRRVFVPYVRLGCAILVKWLVIGRFVPQSAEEKAQPWNQFRYWLMARLLRGGKFAGVANLVGTHYEIISMIYRALGAKVWFEILDGFSLRGLRAGVGHYTHFSCVDQSCRHSIYFSHFVCFVFSFSHCGSLILQVGKHVYWPGSGLDIVEYDLLEVGNDVVFGSRSVVLTSTATRAAKVVEAEW